MTERFAADWLALREPFDAAARSVALAQRLIAVLPARPRLVDLGAGSGSLFRWLAPMIARPQVWTLVDGDADLLERAFEDSAVWAACEGWTVTRPGRALLVHAPGGAWRLEALRTDLAVLPPALFAEADAVLCSALLDLVSASWLQAMLATLRRPLLACLSVDGRDAMLPAHPLDAVVRTGFRRDQQRDKGLGPALGVAAPRVLREVLDAHGFSVASAPSDWRIPRTALAMLRDLVTGHAQAASHAVPARQREIAAWNAVRMRQAIAGRLAIRVGHRDSLGLPPR